MKSIITITLFVLLYFNTNCNAQNLVPNGDFETHTMCPSAISQVEQCTNWIQPSQATPDYFNACASFVNLLVPSNFTGYQVAHSGNAYVGLVTYIHMPPSGVMTREYIEVQLTTPLIAGNCYYFEMFANLRNTCKYNNSDIGVYFSDTLVDNLSDWGPLSFVPQIANPPSNAFDTLNWSLVSGNYVAHGGEQYIIIGNFYVDSLTHWSIYDPSTINIGPYILIDDVSLTLCTGLEEFNQLNITLAPNPFTNNINITTTDNSTYTFTLTDISGRQVLQQTLQGTHEVSTAFLNKGIYFATIRKKDKVVVQKILKQ